VPETNVADNLCAPSSSTKASYGPDSLYTVVSLFGPFAGIVIVGSVLRKGPILSCMWKPGSSGALLVCMNVTMLLQISNGLFQYTPRPRHVRQFGLAAPGVLPEYVHGHCAPFNQPRRIPVALINPSNASPGINCEKSANGDVPRYGEGTYAGVVTGTFVI
jgi:hypothetical protein